MPLYYGTDDVKLLAGRCLTIGNFDGVHLGHQKMIARLVTLAQKKETSSVVLTLHPHPIELLRPEHSPPRLSTLEQKAELLQQYGVDDVIAYPIDRSFLNLTPLQFFQKIIQNQFQTVGIVEGENFYFGRDRSGDISTLQTYCDADGIELCVMNSIEVNDDVVSSTRIRNAISSGEMLNAVTLLGHPYWLRGKVISGEQRGREIGYPTANLSEVETLIPTDGVYAGIVQHDGGTWGAAINIGPNPTFQEKQQKLEVHLLDYQGDLYHQELSVGFLQQIRPVIQFASKAELQHQLQIDMKQIRKVVQLYQSS